MEGWADEIQAELLPGFARQTHSIELFETANVSEGKSARALVITHWPMPVTTVIWGSGAILTQDLIEAGIIYRGKHIRKPIDGPWQVSP